MAGEHIVITGSNGMVATDLHLSLVKFGYRVSALNSTVLDILDKRQLQQTLNQLNKVDFIVNCAAYTDIDACETEVKKSLAVNGKGALHLARYCKDNNIRLIHLSTDYVFNGKSAIPYIENSTSSPINQYGKSKLKGEQNIIKTLSDYYILRTQWVFGRHGKNFVQTITDKTETDTTLDIVGDQIGSPTSTLDIAQAIISLIQRTPKYGVYHFRSENYCSWAELGQFIVDHLNRNSKIKVIETSVSKNTAKRPKNSRLDISKYKKAGLYEPRAWQDAVKDYLDSL